MLSKTINQLTFLLIIITTLFISLLNGNIMSSAGYFLDPPRADGYLTISESGGFGYYIYGYAPKNSSFEVKVGTGSFTLTPSILIWNYNDCPYKEYTNGVDNITVDVCYWKTKFQTLPTNQTNLDLEVQTTNFFSSSQEPSQNMHVGYNGVPNPIYKNKSNFILDFSRVGDGSGIVGDDYCRQFVAIDNSGFKFYITNDVTKNNATTLKLADEAVLNAKANGGDFGIPLYYDVFVDNIKITPVSKSFDNIYSGLYSPRINRYAKKIEILSYDNFGHSSKKTILNCNEQPVNQATKIDFMQGPSYIYSYLQDNNSDIYGYYYEEGRWIGKNSKIIPSKTDLNVSLIQEKNYNNYLNLFYVDKNDNQIKYQYTDTNQGVKPWSQPINTGINTTKSFSAINHLGTYNIFNVAADNKIHTKYFNGRNWVQDRIVSTPTNVQQVQVLVDGEYINLFYLDTNNEVNYVYTRDGKWSNPMKLTGLTTTKKFFVVNHLGTYNAFFIDLDGSLKRVWYNGKNWVDKTTIAGETDLIDVSGFVEKDYINLAFIRNSDKIPRYRYTNNGQWSNPTEIR
jgi:hypothetical protein